MQKSNIKNQNHRSKFKNKEMLKKAVDFHGHLGPYLVLGLKAGELALNKLNCKKYFNLEVRVWGVNKKPKSCLIDGLQLSTGATYGKGNIIKYNGALLKIEFINCENNSKLTVRLNKEVLKYLEETKTHRASEILAKKLFETEATRLFVG